jgi:hypothetical protein
MKTNYELSYEKDLTFISMTADEGSGYMEINGHHLGFIFSRNQGGKHDHVSVSARDGVTPTWEEMCRIKDIFFYEEEEVVQIHPPKSEYVNVVNSCLHLWKRTTGERY